METEESGGSPFGGVAIGLVLVSGGVIGLAGLADNLYVWGLIPARWLLIPGGVMGLSILGTAIASAGLRRSAQGVGAWAQKLKRVWIGAFVLAVLIGVIGTWEEYAAPQEVIVTGLVDEPVEVKVEGEEPFTHTIEAGSQLEFAVPHGRHQITVVAGGREATTDIVHEGFRRDPITVSPPR